MRKLAMCLAMLVGCAVEPSPERSLGVSSEEQRLSDCFKGFWMCPDDGTLYEWAVGICRQECGVADGIGGAQSKCNASCEATCVDGGEQACSP